MPAHRNAEEARRSNCPSLWSLFEDLLGCPLAFCRVVVGICHDLTERPQTPRTPAPWKPVRGRVQAAQLNGLGLRPAWISFACLAGACRQDLNRFTERRDIPRSPAPWKEDEGPRSSLPFRWPRIDGRIGKVLAFSQLIGHRSVVASPRHLEHRERRRHGKPVT